MICVAARSDEDVPPRRAIPIPAAHPVFLAAGSDVTHPGWEEGRRETGIGNRCINTAIDFCPTKDYKRI